ncbi:LytR C-terminal domain-containing protein [Stomatohabitans albus]|uniref:LytR C-terminal domain-containing protein n=1 Tax=Stomatohabitans albus TaxID=3110766 RepID=UPI00300D5EFA
MADHDVSSEQSMASLRAFTAPLFRGLTAAIVVFIIYAAFFGGGSGTTSSTASDNASPGISTAPTAPGTTGAAGTVSVDPSTGALVNPSATDGTTIGSASNAPVGDKPGVGVKVQVLQGASTSKSALDSAVSVLKQLGYTVKIGGRAASDYDTTTVFVVKGKETEADNLSAADPRFKEQKPKPESITADDDIHIAVGSDWSSGSGSGSSASESSSSSSSEGTSSSSTSGSSSESSTSGTTPSYDPSTSAALPAGAQGAAASNTVPNFAGAAANTSTVNSTGSTTNTGGTGTTVVNPAPSASSS